MYYLTIDNIVFVNNREEKEIPIYSILTLNKIHVSKSSLNLNDMIFDINGSVGIIKEIKNNSCIILVVSLNKKSDNESSIMSFK